MYELRHGQWVELGGAPPPRSGWSLTGILAGVLASAAVLAMAIVAATLTVLLVPLGVILAGIAAWRRKP